MSSGCIWNADLEGKFLENAVFKDFNFENANFSHAFCHETKFILAHLEYSKFIGTDLTCADMKCANLKRAKLNNADLRQAWLNGAILCEADFTGADLRDACLHGAVVNGAIFTNALVRSDTFKHVMRLDMAKGIKNVIVDDTTKFSVIGSSRHRNLNLGG